jgi:type IV pilus secretin PilQ/predicted competence protein
MRSASSSLMASLTLLAFTAGVSVAAPTISQWSLQNDGLQETVQIHWSENAQVELNEFVQARQVVAILPGATIDMGIPSSLSTVSSPLIERARLQNVTFPSGEKGVQVTLRLREWTKVEATTTGEMLSLVLTIPRSVNPLANQLSAVSSSGLVLTDQQIQELDNREFGAVNAPRTGAGQSADKAAASPLGKYFVPPQVSSSQLPQGMAENLDQLTLETKLNELVRRVDFQGTSLENVLRLISEEAELNIMLTPSDVSNRMVTLRLRNVTLRQMLDAILKANDLGYTIEDGAIVRVVPRSQVQTSEKEMVMETIAINWVDAVDVQKALMPFVDPDEGSIQVSRANNMLIVRDVPETVRKIQELVNQIDVPEKQVLIEMRLVNMSESARRAFGMKTGFESQSTTSQFGREADANFFDLNDYANGQSSSTWDFSNEGTAETADGWVQGSGFSDSYDNTTDVASNFTQSITQEMLETPKSRMGVGLLAPSANAFTLSNLFTASIFGTDYDVNLQLNAEENRGEATTLAAPQVLSLNNQEASVEIKRQIPYVSAVNSDQGSVATVEFIGVGTQVTILPRITNNGYVMMDIAPEQILDTGERPGGVPLTDERRVQASVIVPDEGTVALGGLREFTATSGENGVPYLLRLPILSWMFKNQENNQDKTELYLFVKPQIVKDLTPTAYQMALYEKIDYNWDLPDYYFDEVYARKAPGEQNDPRVKK